MNNDDDDNKDDKQEKLVMNLHHDLATVVDTLARIPLNKHTPDQQHRDAYITLIAAMAAVLTETHLRIGAMKEGETSVSISRGLMHTMTRALQCVALDDVYAETARKAADEAARIFTALINLADQIVVVSDGAKEVSVKVVAVNVETNAETPEAN